VATGHSAAAAWFGGCTPPPVLDAAEQDRLFRFSALIRSTLAESGAPVALIARAGLDLQRFGHLYSHAGFSLRDSPNTPWSVRQLYYDCDAGVPRLFDQGLPGFLLGGADAAQGHISVLLLPPDAADQLAASLLDPVLANSLLGASYSANAYAHGLVHQNCNQWVAEMLAAAWGALPAGAPPRAAAQAWLRSQGYQPGTVAVHNPLVMLAGALMPWVHLDDHPPQAVAQQRFQVSLPADIEAFVRQQVPGARRIAFCHDSLQMVVQEGWRPHSAGCLAAPGDHVLRFDNAEALPPVR